MYILNKGFSGKVEQKTKIWVDFMVCEVLDYLLNENATNFNCGSVVSTFWLVRNFRQQYKTLLFLVQL